jgi:hypothetical protein
MAYSKYFPERTLTFSQTAARRPEISNELPASLIPNAQRLSNKLQRIQEEINERYPGNWIFVSSGYRSPELNKAVGGSPTSAHKLALAADITAANVPLIALIEIIREVTPDYDQIIYEFGKWVHLGFVTEDKKPRKQLLTAKKVRTVTGEFRTVYFAGIQE